MRETRNFGGPRASVAGDTLHELAGQHDNVWLVVADGRGGAFQEDFGDRYVDVGIAEQNLVGVAAGLALEGNMPFVMAAIPFMTMRACEQIRTEVCYQDLPVRLIGNGGGLTSGGGTTHNAMEDVSIMKSMVNMTVLSIADPKMIRDILILSMTYPHPIYIRLARGRRDLYEPGTVEFKIGMGLTPRDGKDATIIAHGEMVFEAIDAASELAEEGIDVRVVDMYSIKPVDKDLIVKAVKETGHILTLEDHLMEGGLASTVADVFADTGVYPKKFKRLGIPQVYAGFGSGEELRAKYGYDKNAAIAAVRELLA